jgi:NADH pyrophosphatase NudC (nudix superfamily)
VYGTIVVNANKTIDSEDKLKLDIISNLSKRLIHDNKEYIFLRLREFGDNLVSTIDSGLLGTCCGLIKFHKGYQYSSKCDGSTVIQKVGSCCRCSNNYCKTSYYPRLDVASIMLITDSSIQYALLGRKMYMANGTLFNIIWTR